MAKKKTPTKKPVVRKGKSLHVYIDHDLHDRMESFANSTRRSFTAVVEMALEAFLASQAPQAKP